MVVYNSVSQTDPDTQRIIAYPKGGGVYLPSRGSKLVQFGPTIKGTLRIKGLDPQKADRDMQELMTLALHGVRPARCRAESGSGAASIACSTASRMVFLLR